MSLFNKIDEKIKHWLLDCVDASEEYTEYKRKAEVFEEAYNKLSKESANLVRKYERMLHGSCSSITVAIPATMAPWYEDEKFSKLIWDELKSKDKVAFFEDNDKKYAGITVWNGVEIE